MDIFCINLHLLQIHDLRITSYGNKSFLKKNKSGLSFYVMLSKEIAEYKVHQIGPEVYTTAMMFHSNSQFNDFSRTTQKPIKMSCIVI